MLSFHQVVARDFERVNQLIIDQLHSDVGLVENIGHYLVEAGGKRLRPLLVLLCTKALGCQDENRLALAAIIEFIHTATLLHDDVVDVSALRRGRPTANAQWGNAPSVLVGDFLYSRAFQMMVGIGDMRIMKILANTTNVISEGEVQQLVNARNPDISEADYYTVIHKKTAALFEGACQTAAVLAGADDQTQEQLRAYGYHLGLAFQLVDDALDYEGDAATLGKNVGDDLAEGKATLPLLRAMEQGNPNQKDIIRMAVREGSVGQLKEVLEIVHATHGSSYTMDAARQQATLAIARLDALPDSIYKSALTDLANFSVARDH